MEKYQPPVALFFVTDWDEMQPKQRMSALSFVLNGVDKKDESPVPLQVQDASG